MHVAVLVPFRDEPTQNRAAHLKAFLDHMPSVLNTALGEGKWSIFIGIQSDDGHKFARGRVLNALARVVSITQPGCTRLVLHDVDLLPDTVRAAGFQAFIPADKRIVALNTTGEYADLTDYIGGICALSMDTFTDVNGFPNQLEGWGAEDDALRTRLPKGCIFTHTAGTVQNLEVDVDPAAGFVRARDTPRFKMDKMERRRVRDLWRRGDASITGYAELLFSGVQRPSPVPSCYLYDLDVFGWERNVSVSTGRPYYFHSKSGTCQWSVPSCTFLQPLIK
jgi:hypothetical protein